MVAPRRRHLERSRSSGEAKNLRARFAACIIEQRCANAEMIYLAARVSPQLHLAPRAQH
jgi:hypothetical protein